MKNTLRIACCLITLLSFPLSATAEDENLDDLRDAANTVDDEGREAALTDLAFAILGVLDSPDAVSLDSAELKREALEAFRSAANIAIDRAEVKYSNNIMELAVELGDRDAFEQSFQSFMNVPGENNRYVTLIDYALGLAGFHDSGADQYFSEAVGSRGPIDSMEAHIRYSLYLKDAGRSNAALDVLNRYSKEDRIDYFNIGLLRRSLMHGLNMDTTEADEEIADIRKAWANAAGIIIPKQLPEQETTSTNVLGLPEAHAFKHSNTSDDSRGPNAGQWFPDPILGTYYSADVLNATEVLWNEARGEPSAGQTAVAWSMRNRALMNMNGCDFYPGAEGHGGVSACRAATPNGPQGSYQL